MGIRARTTAARRSRPPGRPLLAVVVTALLAAACGGPEIPDPIPVTGQVVRPTTTTTTPAPEDTGTVTPRVVCTTEQLAFVGYASTRDDVVTIPAGPDNAVTDADGEIVTELPGVFAPGVDDVVLAWLPRDHGPLTWTLRDAGTASSLTVGGDGDDEGDDDDAEPCPGAETGGAVPDLLVEGGDVTFEVAVDAERDEQDRITAAVAEIRATGYPTESVCPGGTVDWTPRPRETSLVADLGHNTTVLDGADPGTIRVRIDDTRVVDEDQGEPVVGAANVSLYVDADEVCTDADGNEHRAWSTSTVLASSSFLDTYVCLETVTGPDGTEVVEEGRCLFVLAKTGGIRIR